ncbi:gluconate 2-dehydrogenase subunit 3 family protein [Flavihumibacter stibioxidans]|uniref:Gluconate 2-dehydrogenase subunit 3-like protein n=1 Tax=Flavihumibacter stibioxidans TaxID=1834163 RepID=A0ABR7MDJ1_9BACT|nr:gluconate 2-dehydrogenase subunit 3 family protein [Flavihumibacter stibioxidans]MBC6492579.1 hypothetical protein [Flavihumibacter stibioxidans]
MNRREVISHMIWMGAGIAFLPSCVYKQDQVSIQLKKIQINPKQEKFLTALAAAIIPATDTPGATELGAHLFALKMVDDCMTKESQDAFMAGLKSLQAEEPDPAKLMTAAEAADNKEQLAFLKDYRRLVVQGYTMSEYVMTNLLPYQLVPGKYYGCVPVKSLPAKS